MKRLLKFKFKYQDGNKVEDLETLKKLEEEKRLKDQQTIDEQNKISEEEWGALPDYPEDTRTDEEYFYDTRLDRRIPSDGPIQAKKIIGEKSPKLKLNEDYYKDKLKYTEDVTNQFEAIKKESQPETSSTYAPELKYNSYYTEGEHESDIAPFIKDLEERELSSYDSKVEEYIADSLMKLGFKKEDLGERAKYTRDELYNNIKPEIIKLLESKGLKLDKVNWDRVKSFSDKKYNKRIDKVVKTANTNPLLKQASPRMIENKLTSILEKGRFKDPYEGLQENQIKIAEGLKGRVDESLREDIIKDMKKGKSEQEIIEKYKKDINPEVVKGAFKELIGERITPKIESKPEFKKGGLSFNPFERSIKRKTGGRLLIRNYKNKYI